MMNPKWPITNELLGKSPYPAKSLDRYSLFGIYIADASSVVRQQLVHRYYLKQPKVQPDQGPPFAESELDVNFRRSDFHQ